MASHTTTAADLHELLERSLERLPDPGKAELCELLCETLRPILHLEPSVRIERLKEQVYRLSIGSGPTQSFVLKQLNPAVAQTDRLVVERWLPALGLADRCPQLIAGAAQRDGCWVWHAYEDLGDETLNMRREPSRLAAAVTLIADLH